jgi:ectoine hydroxylase-related dioxygenase (phytanoyl-CoA dioxygenase family)
MGTLAICEGSHNLDTFKKLRETYGKIDVEDVGLKGTGWFSEDAREITKMFGGQWKTATFEPGDVLIFTLHTLHMSTTNLTDKVRISCDVRWQPKTDPADKRFSEIKDKTKDEGPKFGVYAKEDAKDNT